MELDGSVESILGHAETLIETLLIKVKRKMVVEDKLIIGIRLYLQFWAHYWPVSIEGFSKCEESCMARASADGNGADFQRLLRKGLGPAGHNSQSITDMCH